MISFTRSLLAWFRRNRRDLPWRRIRTPYSTWISEIMLQQTVVAAVAPRFEAWLERYPDARSLARAPLEEILRVWEGLGYYNRARNLHAAAIIVASEHGGQLPRTFSQLRALPGIGDYTAAAILSIAHGLPFPVLDANVKRVTQRLLALKVWTPAAARAVFSFLKERLPQKNPGDFNEAMMELGALICVPRAPHCRDCPIEATCRSRSLGIADRIPERRKRVISTVTSTIVIAVHGESVWIVDGSRVDRETGPAPRSGKHHGRFLEGLSAFPRTTDVTSNVTTELGRGVPMPSVVHSYLQIRERLHPLLVRLRTRAAVTRSPGRWVSMTSLEALPMPSAYRRIARRIPLSRA